MPYWEGRVEAEHRFYFQDNNIPGLEVFGALVQRRKTLVYFDRTISHLKIGDTSSSSMSELYGITVAH